MKFCKSITLATLLLLVVTYLSSCNKSEPSPQIVPTLQTSVASNITNTTAQTGGSVTSDGGATVSSRGVCWSTSQNPTIALSTKTSDGTGAGSFVSNLTGLSANTTYYVRAYATNSVGTNYGSQINFTTAPDPLKIGQTYAGGIICNLDATGQHGYVIASSDQSTGAPWNPNSGNAANYNPTVTGATAQTIGTGSQNTDKIIAAIGNGNNAASICRNYRGGGYTDWFLPNLGEWLQAGSANGVDFYTIFNIPQNVTYWTSSEATFNGTTAAYILWTGPATNPVNDSRHFISYRVRAMRAF